MSETPAGWYQDPSGNRGTRFAGARAREEARRIRRVREQGGVLMTRTRTRLVGLLVAITAASAVAAPVASAGYFLNRREATHYMRDYLHYNRGYPHTQAYCEPRYGGDTTKYDFHTWKCYWRGLDEDYVGICRGITIIKGSSDEGSYYRNTVWKRGSVCY